MKLSIILSSEICSANEEYIIDECDFPFNYD